MTTPLPPTSPEKELKKGLTFVPDAGFPILLKKSDLLLRMCSVVTKMLEGASLVCDEEIELVNMLKEYEALEKEMAAL